MRHLSTPHTPKIALFENFEAQECIHEGDGMLKAMLFANVLRNYGAIRSLFGKKTEGNALLQSGEVQTALKMPGLKEVCIWADTGTQ